jgi:hypothetical protein
MDKMNNLANVIFVNMLYISDTNTFFVTNYPLYKQAKANIVAVFAHNLVIWQVFPVKQNEVLKRK